MMIKEVNAGVIVFVRVYPNAKEKRISYDKWKKCIKVHVDAPAVGGRANEKLVQYLRSIFGTECKIIKGIKSRDKKILVEGIRLDDVENILDDIYEKKK